MTDPASLPASRPAPLERRSSDLVRLADTTWDVLIVGGGVVGSGALLDAASRGLSAALIEQDDIAAGTSSRSSRLIHGGLRYLEQVHLPLVHEALELRVQRGRLVGVRDATAAPRPDEERHDHGPSRERGEREQPSEQAEPSARRLREHSLAELRDESVLDLLLRVARSDAREALRQLALALESGGVPYQILGQLAWYVREKMAAMHPNRVAAAVDALFRTDLDDEQRLRLARVHAFLAIAEAYPGHVRATIAVELLPGWPQIREALRRRDDGAILDPVFGQLLGIPFDPSIVADARAFCETVVAQADDATLASMWSSADAMPSMPEIREPTLWLSRTV